MLTHWNVLATAHTLQFRPLQRMLRAFGSFTETPFPGVLVGIVTRPEALFEALVTAERERPGLLRPLARMLPIERTFAFTLETLEDALRQAVLPYAETIGNGTFYVRMERRGHKGELHSQPLEQALDHALETHLEARGRHPAVDFADPDVIVAIETVGDICGVGLLPRALRARYPFVRVP